MSEKLKILAVAAATVAASLMFLMTLVRATVYSPAEEAALSMERGPPATAAPGDLPEQLIIPALAVEADVQHVGINRAGNMAVPTNYQDVGWYRYGAVPGFLGSAVIDGHLDNGFGIGAVFKRLNELQAGDLITVVTRTGEEIHFKVEEVAVYDTADVPRMRVFNRADKARLNLITCDGDWNSATKDYSKRVVVYAVLV